MPQRLDEQNIYWFPLVPGPPQSAPPMKRPHMSTPPSAGIVPFSPMEQMEELTADVGTSSYCDRNSGNGNGASSDVGFGEDGNNSSLEEALGINFHDSGGGVQRELVAK